MDYNTFMRQDTEYPADIAEMLVDRLADLCSAGVLEEDIDDNNLKKLVNDLTDVLYFIKTSATNEYNNDSWRTTYKVLSDLCEGR